jgi:hypothetical protein
MYVRNDTLTNIFWGLFLVWFGVVWTALKGDFFSAVNSPVFGLGVGTLLILLNLSRVVFHLPVSPFTLVIGFLVFIVDFTSLFLSLSFPFLPLILIIAGVLILISSIRASRYFG